VVVSKAGHHTHGLDRFFAGVYGRVIPSLAACRRVVTLRQAGL
jgi:hypothetical protein